MAELGKLPKDLGNFKEQTELAEFGDRVTGIVQDMGVRDMEKDGRSYRVMVYKIKVTDRVPSDYTDQVHEISHNWAKKDDEDGNPIIARNSQARLCLWLMQTQLGTTQPAKIMGQHVEFERHSISELPGYDAKAFKNLSKEQPRLYPVKILS